MATRRTLFRGALVLSAALTLSACATGNDAAPIPGQSTPPVETTPPIDADAPGLSEQRNDASTTALHPSTEAALAAIMLAETHAGGVAYELDDEDDDASWEIDVNAGGTDVEVRVTWQGTEVLSVESDGSVDDDDLRKLSQVALSLSDAIVVANDHAGGRVAQVDLDSENGVVVWEVEFEDGDIDWDVTVNAHNGEIIEVHRD